MADEALKSSSVFGDFSVTGTIANFTTKNFGGNYDLTWGKWIQTPVFPIKASDLSTFKCTGRDGSPSGCEGTINLTVPGEEGELVLYVTCPFSGKNYFRVNSNTIAGVAATVQPPVSTSGHPISATLKLVPA